MTAFVLLLSYEVFFSLPSFVWQFGSGAFSIDVFSLFLGSYDLSPDADQLKVVSEC